MYSGKFIATLISITLVISCGIGYLVGQSSAKADAYYMQGKTNKVIGHIKKTYPEQWQEIEASRAWIEYDIAKKER